MIGRESQEFPQGFVNDQYAAWKPDSEPDLVQKITENADFGSRITLNMVEAIAGKPVVDLLRLQR